MKPIYNVLIVLSLLGTVLTAQSAHALVKPIDKSQQLFEILKSAGLKTYSPFKEATILEAYDLSCVSAVIDETHSQMSCDLANRPHAPEESFLHVEGRQALRLNALLRTAPVVRGETGSSTLFIRCARYAYDGVGTTFECQVATPFNAHK